MEQLVEREESIRKYLLGELAEQEQTRVQILLLTDEGYLNELLLLEDEFTDDFVFGTLSGHEQERIRDRFLSSPEQHEKLKLTKAFEQYVSELATASDSEITWERALAEAQENRYLLGSLLEENWMGLHVLALLRSSPHDNLDVIKKLGAESSVLTPILIRLMECGAIEEQDDVFFCTSLGFETLVKIEDVVGVSLL